MTTEQKSSSDAEIVAPKGWTKVPTIRELKQDQSDARPIHDAQVLKITGWLDNLNLTGSAVIKKVPGQSSVQPQLIRKQAEWRYAALSEPFLSTDDVFNVSPVTSEDREASQQNQLLLNHQLNTTINKTKFFDEYVRTGVDEGTIIVQTGWEFIDEKYTEDVPDIEFRVNPEFAQIHEELAAMRETNPSLYDTDVEDEMKQAHELSIENGQPIEPVLLGTVTATEKTRILSNRPTLEICNYKNITIDPTAKGDMLKAQFIIKSYETSKSALRKDGKTYHNLEKINVDGNSILASPDHSPRLDEANFNFSDDDRKKFVVYQYWGKRVVDDTGITTTFVSEWVGNTMIRLEEAPFPDKELPFVVVHYLPVRKSNYGEPDGSLLIDNQKIAGAVSRGMIDIMGKSANGQTGMRKDMLDATNRRKFDSGKDYEYNGGVDPRQGVFMHTYPEIPQSAPFMLQLQNQEAESLTGVQAFSAGISGASLGDVAVGVRGALDAASKRELGILRRLSNGVVEIGHKIISMNAVFLSDEEVVRITDSEFVTVRKDDLPGVFDLKLSISTAEEDDNKAEQLAFLLQTMGPNMDPELIKMILSDIARLRKMPDMAEKIENYNPEPDPVQVKLQELEVAKLEGEIAKTQAETQKILVEAGLTDAKIDTEGAKASHLNSQKDKTDLDFVEQQTGTTQERNLQSAGAQAAANSDLAILQSSLKRGEERERAPK